ncbi:hypothetical protein GCM10022422_34190 [Flavobacterium ginsengisoli]|uniref:DUF304 domain-containing protein n=1 Tax=Flavobacterium ginsengisoli TaxID=871694 RepID=A0ABP7FSV6_9FLAO|nr:hypothetical protein [Flavobacterium ginsengisoli]
MEIVNENVKVYQSSKKDQFIFFAIVALLIILFSAFSGSILAVVFWFVFFLLCGTLAFVASVNLKFTIDSEKEVITVEKINFLGNVVEIKQYPLNRYYFERRFVKMYKNRKKDCFSFSDSSYEGGELYYNKEFYTDDYIIEGLPKKMVRVIENDIQKMQDKKGQVLSINSKLINN